MGYRGNGVGGIREPQSVSGGEKSPGHGIDSDIFRLRRKGIGILGLWICYAKREQVGESCQYLLLNSASVSAARMGDLPMLPHLCPSQGRLRLILGLFLVLSQRPGLCTHTTHTSYVYGDLNFSPAGLPGMLPTHQKRPSRMKADGGCTSEKGLQASDNMRTEIFLLADTEHLNQGFLRLCASGWVFPEPSPLMLLWLLSARFLTLAFQFGFPQTPLCHEALFLDAVPEAKIRVQSFGEEAPGLWGDSEEGKGREQVGGTIK